MDKKKSNEDSPIYLGQFRDKTMEKEYYNAEISKRLSYVKFIVLLLGALYFLFIIPDYFLLKNSHDFIFVLINRGVVFGAMIVLYFKIRQAKEYYSLIYWFTAYEILISLSFLYIADRFTSPDFLIQAFGVMIIILAIFLINNRWLYSIFASLFIGIGYFIFAAFTFEPISLSVFSAAIVYIIIVTVLSSISSYSINYYKRIQYLNNIKLLKLAENDPLTGIYNKGKFSKEYKRLIDRAKKKNAYLTVVMLDIDDFKDVNDRYGHLVGDTVLTDLTNIISRNIKKSDVFARWGGEEFVLIFPDIPLIQAIEITERLRKFISEHIFATCGQVTCSFGVAALRKNDDLDTVLQRADDRLYLAKNSGKNKVM